MTVTSSVPIILNLIILHQGIHSLRPEGCPCEVDSVERSAVCDGLQMSTVPECIPNSTKLLTLVYTLFEELSEKQFERFKTLEYLDVSFNHLLKALQPGAFLGLSNLKELKLNFDDLRYLNRSSFIGLTKLEDLSIYGSAVEHIGDYAFSELSSLKTMELNENKIKHINRHSFSGLSVLDVLSLSYNPIHFSEPDRNAFFLPLVNLKELHLVGICKYSFNCEYRDEQIAMLPSLKKLYIDGISQMGLAPAVASLRHLEDLVVGKNGYCTIEEINKISFQYLMNAPLTRVYIENCVIRTVVPFAFAKLRYMTSLTFEYNSICLDGLRNLTMGLSTTSIKHLKLSGLCPYPNHHELTASSLEGLKHTSLETLDLTHCSIAVLRKNIYLVLPKSLKYLNLKHNSINYVYLDNLKELTNLSVLDMSDQTMPANTYARGYRLGGLRKQFGDAASVSRTDKSQLANPDTTNTYHHTASVRISEVTDDCITMPPRLRTIDISNSDLLYSVLRMFCSISNSLQILRISHQQRNIYLPLLWERLKNLPKLRILDLDSNDIRDIPNDLFFPLRRLDFLSLADNGLIILKFEVKTLKKLDILNLSGNKIQYATSEFTRKIEYIATTTSPKLTVLLSKNTLLCDCKTIGFVSWLKHTHVVDGKDQLTCKYQNGTLLSLRHVSNIHRMLESECIVSTVVVSCTAGFFTLLLILSLIAVVYNKRLMFRYLQTIGRRNINPYHPLEGSNIELLYDVYISYDRDYEISGNQTLHEFVSQKLYPYLQRHSFRVIIRDELQAGMRLYDIISKALRSSRRVIILLTNSYCKDNWNVFEFNIAVMEGIYTKRQVVIPVMMEPLNRNDLQEEVCALLTSELVPRYSRDTEQRVLLEYLCERIRSD